MCELFCFNSDKSKRLNERLKSFYNHSKDHPHGWGIANVQSGEWVVEKEPVKASSSCILKEMLSHPIVSKTLFAHIRLATVGELVSCNCHPFIKSDDGNRAWMLMHNGTIFEFPELEKYRGREKGDTDSERILLYLIDMINDFERSKGGPSTVEERFTLIKNMIFDLSYDNKLNIMIYDGEITYVHSNVRDSLYYLEDDGGYLIVSSPISDDENWQNVELNKLFAFKNGKIIFQSERHENEFIFTQKHELIIKKLLEESNLDCLYEDWKKTNGGDLEWI